MALTYARSLCRLDSPNATIKSPGTLEAKAAGDSSKDAVAWFQSTFNSLGMPTNKDGRDTLRALYTLGIGLGMRESSGNYCEGYDTTASSTSAVEAESGLFQTSYNSMGASSELKKLYDEYRADTSKCHLNVFKEGAASCKQGYIGSGAGLEFQKFERSCPSFAAEYAMANLRVLRKHYGPINRKEAEVKAVCDDMLEKVQNVVLDNPNACSDLE